MLLDPGAGGAVEKLAVRVLTAAVPRMLPLLLSVKVTEPVGVPLAALTVAVNVTHESRVIDAEDAVSAVVVVIKARDDVVPAAAAAGRTRPPAGASTASAAAARITARWMDLMMSCFPRRRCQRMFPRSPSGLEGDCLRAGRPRDSGGSRRLPK